MKTTTIEALNKFAEELKNGNKEHYNEFWDIMTELTNEITKYHCPDLIASRAYSGAELLTDIYFKMDNILDKFAPSTNFKALMTTICQNRIIDIRRSIAANNKHMTNNQMTNDEGDTIDIIDTLGDEFLIEDNAINEEAREILDEIMKKLDKKFYDVLTKKYFEKKTVNEIAEELDSSVSTVNNWISRGKKSLVKLIEDSGMKEFLFDEFIR